MKRQILLRGSTQNNADILYFSGVSIHDPFFAFSIGDKKCALLNSLEIGRARRTSSLDEIFDISSMGLKDDIAALSLILKKYKINNLLVPADFPSIFLEKLRALKFDVLVSESSIFPKRALKSKSEIAEIIKANSIASAGFEIAEEMLRNSRIAGKKLLLNGRALTSEWIRSEIEKIAITLGADAPDTIVASGDQACDPHEKGRGIIAPNSLIVIDIFPRLRSSGYFGDMTRTFLKGTPSKAQSKLVETVIAAQSAAISKIKAGVNGSNIHSFVCKIFEKNKFLTDCKKGTWSGFIHSTGHGVGLDIHEVPNLGKSDNVLKSGNVVTVEPGLYYKGLGGCRIEDTVAVEKSGARVLSKYHYNWIID